ncbi:MAG TPA: hypothetical protein VLY23_09265 [Candidatus Acidoferrum sp.]|nr:hypothetical protein [Candidatus Acidoferrum sp.]
MPDEKKVDPFKPQAPQIPGVPAAKPPRQAPSAEEPAPASVASERSGFPLGLMIAGVAVVAFAVAVVWWVHGSSAKEPAPAPAETPVVASAPPAKPAPALPIGPGNIATADELSKAWSAKRFVFVNQTTFERIPALAVRLPGGTLWGISLREPYGTCELEWVTDVERLRSVYHVRAEHPMVADPCSKSVYDLGRYGNGPNGLVRGAIVRGRAMRPPIAIEVAEHGNHIVAVQME